MLVNAVLSIIKFLAGWLGHSHAVMADAVHGVSDTFTDGVIWIGSLFWDRPPDERHPHGHRKIEILVTLAVAFALTSVAVGLIARAVSSLREGNFVKPGLLPLGAALLSVGVKEALYRWTLRQGRRLQSVPLQANAWHHRSDALSSIPAAIAVGVAAAKPSWIFLDRVGEVVVSVIILHAAFKIAWPTLQKLVDVTAPLEQLVSIQDIAAGTEGVREVHALRARYVGTTRLAVDLHVLVDPEMNVKVGHDIASRVRDRLIEQQPGVVDVVVHVEPYDAAESVRFARRT